MVSLQRDVPLLLRAGISHQRNGILGGLGKVGTIEFRFVAENL